MIGKENLRTGDNLLIIIQMRVLQLDEKEEECKISEVRHMLGIALAARNYRHLLSNPSRNKHQQTYQGPLLLPRAQTWTDVVWRICISESIIQLQLQLSSAGSLSSAICSVLLQSGQQVHEFVHLINNLTVCDREGYFIFKQLTGQLMLRYKIAKIRYLSHPHSKYRYINKALNTAIALFAQQLEHILFYYRFSGFELGEIEEHLQHRNHVPLKQGSQNIIFLQHYFEAQRRQRSGSSKDYFPTSYTSSMTSLQAYTILLFSKNQVMDREQTCKTQFEQRLQFTQGLFKYQLATLVKDITYEKTKSPQLILTSIKIKQRRKEEIIGTGGYAQIIHGIYSYIPQASIHAGLQMLTRKQQKIGLQNPHGDGNVSLQNQCNFLKYIRNKVCPFVAKYYCNNEGKQPFSNREIYLQYYPNNLGECRLTQTRKMKVMEDVCMALLFLAQEKLIHRDLKQVNIMVDRYNRGRLIDFGSVCNITGSHKFRTRDEKVRSTKGYYLPYRQAMDVCPNIEKFLSRNEYYSHKAFDLYGLGKVMQNQFYLTQIVGSSHFVRHNLMLLSQKCREVNPQDRWTIQEVAIFIRHLLLFNELRRQFWRWGFDPRFKPHQLGKSYNGSGGYECRQQEVVFLGKTGCTPMDDS